MIPLILPELPQTLRFESVPTGGCDATVRADSAACEALAARMQIPAVLDLVCRFALRRTGGRVIAAEGWLQAGVVLTCVVTAEPFEWRVEEAFEVRFVPAGTEQDAPDPDSIDFDAIDEIPYEDGVLAIGEAAAEQLALALPAFPRGPDADALVNLLREDHVVAPNPSAISPFAALAARRKSV